MAIRAFEPELYSRADKPMGRAWEKWVELWWKWCYGAAPTENPVADHTGRFCDGGQIHHDVWFLAGTFGGIVERRCTIPSSRSIFFPVVNDLISHAEYPRLRTDLDLRNYARADLDETRFISVEVDGNELKSIKDYRIQSDIFNISLMSYLPKHSFIETRAVSDGYWIFLKPLTSGEHIIEFVGEKLAFDEIQTGNTGGKQPIFKVGVKYRLIVL